MNRNAVQQMKKNFANMLNNPQKTSPSLFLSLDMVELDSKLLLHAYIPVSSQIQSCSGRIYDRNEIIQQVAPGYVTDCLLRVKNTDRYDDRLRVETNLIESFDAIMGFIAKHTNDPFFLIDNRSSSVRDIISKEIVSNILVHREYSGTFPARVIIEKDRLVAENWNRALRHGRIDPRNFEPYPKNPILARFFVNIGNADTLGSGIRNLVTSTKLYSGGEPELIEGEIFRTIIPLGDNVPTSISGGKKASGNSHGTSATRKVAETVAEKVTEGEYEVFDLIARNGEITQNEIAVQLNVSRKTVYMRIKSLKEKGLLRRLGSDTKGSWEVTDSV